jgi:hypothetical protein
LVRGLQLVNPGDIQSQKTIETKSSEAEMFKRIALVMTFLAAFAVAGSSLAPQAQAWRGGGWDGPYRSNYYGPPRYSYYGGGYGRGYYAPYRAYYGPRVYRSYYGPAPYYYGPGPGVAVTFGY